MPTRIFQKSAPSIRQVMILSDEGEHPSRDWNNHGDRHFLGSHGLGEGARMFNYKVDADGALRKFDPVAGCWVAVGVPVPESHLTLLRSLYPEVIAP